MDFELLALTFVMLRHMLLRYIKKLYRFLTGFEDIPSIPRVYQPLSEGTVACSTELQISLTEKVFFAQDTSFKESLASYWSTINLAQLPHCIVRPSNAQDVATAIRILSKAQTPFAVRSGGHSSVGASAMPNGVVIDLRALDEITVAEDRASVRLGPGLMWKQVYERLEKVGLVVPGGRTGDVGVGGLTLGGGLSYLSPRTGFVCDAVLDFEVVLASGDIVHANATENADLYPALRGGGSNFGVVTALTMKATESTLMRGGTSFYSMDKAPAAMQAFHNFLANPDYDDHAMMILSFGYSEYRGLQGVACAATYTKPVEHPACFREIDAVKPLFSMSKVQTLTQTAIGMSQDSPRGRQLFVSTTLTNELHAIERAQELYVPAISKIANIDGAICGLCFHSLPTSVFEAGKQHGGNVLGLDNQKEPLVICQLAATWSLARDDAFVQKTIMTLMGEFEAYNVATGCHHPWKFLNYAEKAERPIESYGQGNLRFLREVSKKYDPNAVFQNLVSGGFKLWPDETLPSTEKSEMNGF